MSVQATKTILIVDDDPAVMAAISARLSGVGYRCLSAPCGARALALFEREGADLIISDLNMPQGDGAALAMCIRRRTNAPIIVISGFKDAHRKVMRDVPDVIFMQKPFETRTLVDLVESALAAAEPATIGQARAA